MRLPAGTEPEASDDRLVQEPSEPQLIARTHRGQSPSRPGTIRVDNLALVVGILASSGPMSRANVSIASGLTKSSVSDLVKELLNKGLVIEAGIETVGTAGGRPGTVIAINDDGAAGLGLEINVDYLSVCVTDLGHQTRFSRFEWVDNRTRPLAQVVEHLGQLAQDALAHVGQVPVLGAALALPGLVDAGSGKLVRSTNLTWSDVDIGALLTEHIPPGLPLIAIDNSTNLAALGEQWSNPERSLGDFVLVSGGYGIGAGVVMSGKLLKGARGFAGEIGHLPVHPGGVTCRCGQRGCLQAYAGEEAILEQADRDGAVPAATGLINSPIERLVRLLDHGHGPALRATDVAAEALGIALSSVLKIVDTETIVLGGIYADLAPWLLTELDRQLTLRLFTEVQRPRIVVSDLGSDAASRGAADLVVRGILSDPAGVSTSRRD